MSNETPVFRYGIHKKMWDILAENPGMSKETVTRQHLNTDEYCFIMEEYNYCPACVYSFKVKPPNPEVLDHCGFCPLDTKDVYKNYPELERFMDSECSQRTCLRGLYNAWYRLTSIINHWGKKYDETHVITMECIKYFKLGGGTLELAKELCIKYASAIANLKPKEGILIK